MAIDQTEPVAVASPGFEGFEKRLEIEFRHSSTDPISSSLENNYFLRSLSHSALDEILSAAQCTIVSALSNRAMDSYVLSESSLFVYPLKIIIKTCGTTQLLHSIPPLLKHAASLSLTAHRCRYSRGAFLFPEAQPFPHTDFSEEVQFLDNYFGNLGSKACVIDGEWHVYSAEAEKPDCNIINPWYTVELCMTKLDRDSASKFFKKSGLLELSAGDMTVSSGIVNILPDFQVCDFAFDPCGYSMNAIEDQAYATIHVTPEENCSYASFEIMEYRARDLQDLIYRVASVFKPSVLLFSLYSRTSKDHEEELGFLSPLPNKYDLLGYNCRKSIRKELLGGGVLDFFSFTRRTDMKDIGII